MARLTGDGEDQGGAIGSEAGRAQAGPVLHHAAPDAGASDGDADMMTGRFHIKRIYEPPLASDGQRVLIDRLWPRGVRREDAALTYWFKDLAPTAALRTWFDHDPRRWAEFGRRYRRELDMQGTAMTQLCGMLEEGDVTLLYAARDAHINHAVVLADYARDWCGAG